MERNRLIDGWRGVCVILVIADHFLNFQFADYLDAEPFRQVLARSSLDISLLAKNVVLRLPHTLADLALNIFLVISGYLITRQLWREEDRTGLINIQAFYVRRFFRIVPTLYAFLVVSFFLTKITAAPATHLEFFSAAAFLCNTSLGDCGWWFGHTFSLSIQEQFYILWPLGFALLGPALRSRGLLAIFAAFLLLSYFDTLSVSWINNSVYFGSIAAGALYASSGTVARLVDEKARGNVLLLLIALLLVRPFAASLPFVHNLFDFITPAAVAIIFFGSLKGSGVSTAILSNGLMVKIGTISYSLYLWQQMFTGKPPYDVTSGLSSVFFILIAALISYVLIERQSTRLGQRLSARMIEFAKADSGRIYSKL